MLVICNNCYFTNRFREAICECYTAATIALLNTIVVTFKSSAISNYNINNTNKLIVLNFGLYSAKNELLYSVVII